MRARGFTYRERRQLSNEDDLMPAKEVKVGGHFAEATEPSKGLADVMHLPSLSVKLKELVELR